MEKSFICPDCGAALPSKGAKCPYKTERKNRSIKKAQDPNSKLFRICVIAAVITDLFAILALLIRAEELAFAFAVLTIIIFIAGFFALLIKGDYYRAFATLSPSIFILIGLYQQVF